jgi:hypothetical protein
MTEPSAAIAYEPTETLTLTNVIGIATGEPIPPPVKPKRKYTRKAKKARAPRASKVNAAIMPKPSIGVQTLKDGQAGDAISAWSPPVPPVSMMRSIYDLLTPPGGNQGTRILRFSERFWLLLLSALSVSIGTTAAVYWW